jgi:type I restriction-modification system DNA methylase subunit
LPEGANIGRALNQAMSDIETNNPELADTLPKNYQEVPNQVLVELIKLLDPVTLEGDAFGKVYEFMMGEFAMQEMQKGGEFYTPVSIVRLIVEIIEPYPEDEVLFIDARRIFRQIDRAHRDFTAAQVEFLANIVRLWRGTETFLADGSLAQIRTHFQEAKYRDVPGLCRRATRKEIEVQGWSLNPGRYVGVAPGEADDVDFRERLEELQEELERLNAEAALLQSRIAQNVAELLA